MAPVSDVEVEGSSVSDGRGRGGGSLSLDDCRCPVCLEILMEPVTLPCTHTFCKGCFLESVDKATLCCPMCRKRVSTWARLHSRNNTLVNQQLWRQIQSCFPLQCERRLTGQEVEDDPGVSVCSPTVSRPGELRQEYEDQITKLTEEKRVLDEEERRASEEYIQRLLAEEEELLQEDSRRREEDERLARLLSNQLNSAPLSQESLRPADVTPVRKKKEASAGQIEKFLCPLPSKTNSSDCSSSSSFVANKENILLSQAELQGECAPPKLDYYGAPTDRPEPPDLHTDLHPAFMEDQTHRSHLIGDRPSSTKRKSSELEATEEEEVVIITKRGCRSLPSSSSSLEASEWESELLSRRRQEEEDRRLAVIMQRELDQEERRRATDRRKGSADAYLLRQKQRGRVEAGADTDTAGGHSRKTPKASSSRGHKQTTLTEMFSSLSS
ncbi:E3 ubiquitin-protein ligase rnf168 isoform X1 [Toxotes jaculatrix]|uniref:E3 ubiquitin-protein ligase rnf168 isoform X1 n=1 Tax=Toxotes jaculatrix TaxID=941984 RepID=UPI001B3A7F64|nr:E3 ubiquitin-protein ligase rnf168 isoform X1 [Toxotes jaculatrix]XP_040902786.1 E3 ubiquitin-protein ligase rnf168 isoform X1 [Toxotes jaculatrix]XP_040902787.1 E3 ubiquitin-protein ligase rnf168 isoform X1 [Toxotes jaculatrix]XP_040902788.1 E3 ubiquitin-protein ligase rnf168 isoform X1 [Toxotes jaculatrix]XP_040902789.1 E3 ubiquitin-protein ligase rnf168 isoform X1 [Toxotes jaculatrix]XP_040902790.1 E3 ubiquitin-protein ligase rnf168 isoform X1 [Toxotes jaculatrix]XP_040902792.1 E3 ubiqu